jgi:hypothetical protein
MPLFAKKAVYDAEPMIAEEVDLLIRNLRTHAAHHSMAHLQNVCLQSCCHARGGLVYQRFHYVECSYQCRDLEKVGRRLHPSRCRGRYGMAGIIGSGISST